MLSEAMAIDAAKASHALHSDVRVTKCGTSLVSQKILCSSKYQILIVPSESKLRIFSSETGEQLLELSEHTSEIVGVSYVSGNEDRIISCDTQGTVLLWNFGTDDSVVQERWTLPRHYHYSTIVSFHADWDASRFYVLYKDAKDSGHLYYYSCPQLTPMKLCEGVILGPNKVSVNKNSSLVAAIAVESLFIRSPTKYIISKRHLIQSRTFTCVQCHPDDDVVATGDSDGRIIIWYEPFSSHPKKTILHWHSAPLADILFSVTGNEIYSVGKECVIVKWQLIDETKTLIVRLGMPICFISSDQNNTMLVSSHVDNALQIVDAKENILKGIIQSFANNPEKDLPFSAGIVIDPRTNALVVNGKMGFIQFFDFLHDKQLYSLDITLCNYLQKEEHADIQNTDVMKLDISSDGKFLATVEYHPDPEFSFELRLKFWTYDIVEERWTLNTSVEMPHENIINGVVFQPLQPGMTYPLCASFSEDRKVKVWIITEAEEFSVTRLRWQCSFVTRFRNLSATAARFSPDSSLLCVAFEHTVTLWLPDLIFKCMLCQPYLTERISQVEFGRGDKNCSMLVARSDNWLCAWDIFQCSLKWRVCLQSTCLAADPLSPYIAVFSKNSEVFVFEPCCCDPVFSWSHASFSEVITAAFIPHLKALKKGPEWCQKSTLVFINAAQELYKMHTMKDSRLDKKDSQAIRKNLKMLLVDCIKTSSSSPFAALVAETLVSHKTGIADISLPSANFGVTVEKGHQFIKEAVKSGRTYHFESFPDLAKAYTSLLLPDVSDS